MKKLNLLLILPFFIFMACSTSELTYYTHYQGQTDPEFILNDATTIGLTPKFWTKQGQINKTDELSEKILLNYMKSELESRGAKPFIIPIENLAEDENGNIVYKNHDHYPDLILTCDFFEKKGSTYIPEETEVSCYNSTIIRGGHSVFAYTLFIQCSLWSEAPKFNKAVWKGSVIKGSPIPNLSEVSKKMIHNLFKNKFLKN